MDGCITSLLSFFQPQLMGKDDSDSGYADVSHTESQGSNDDPDGFIQKHGIGNND